MPASAGFCPVGFYVPDWWDVHDGAVIPGSKSWNEDRGWPRGEWGFVWDLRQIPEGIIKRDGRFGYIALATHSWNAPWTDLERPTTTRSRAPEFIRVSPYEGASHVGFDVELEFDLDSGARRSEDV